MGQRLRECRKAKGFTQAKLALLSGVSQGTIGNIESGIRGYGESLIDIARALNVSADYLRCESDKADLISTDAEGTTTLVEVKQSAKPPETDQLIELINLYQQASDKGKNFILKAALSAEKAHVARWIRASNES